MKKYYPVDFDEKGKVILGNAKNTPTSNGFIPTTWAPGGEAGNGIKSITISPAITTTPALASLLPIYYENLTEEQKQSGVTLILSTDAVLEVGAEYTFTITPTADMYAIADEPGEKGEPITTTAQVVELGGVPGMQLEEVFITSTLEQPTENDMSFTARVLIGSTH